MLFFQSLDGFLLVAMGDGTITYISESIHKHLGLFQVCWCTHTHTHTHTYSCNVNKIYWENSIPIHVIVLWWLCINYCWSLVSRGSKWWLPSCLKLNNLYLHVLVKDSCIVFILFLCCIQQLLVSVAVYILPACLVVAWARILYMPCPLIISCYVKYMYIIYSYTVPDELRGAQYFTSS